MDMEKEQRREAKFRKRAGSVLAIIKAKSGLSGKAVKITNMKMLCMFQMIASITTKAIRNSQKEKRTETGTH